MNDQERSCEEGSRHELLLILGEVLEHLGCDCPEARAAAWIQEREETVIKLRRICAVYGDNNWPDNAKLGDVIEKHLQRHLDNPRMPT